MHIYIYIHIYITFMTLVRHFPLKMPHPRNPPNLETQIPRYKLKRHQNLNLNLHRKIPTNPSFSMWWISVCSNFSGNCHILSSEVRILTQISRVSRRGGFLFSHMSFVTLTHVIRDPFEFVLRNQSF